MDISKEGIQLLDTIMKRLIDDGAVGAKTVYFHKQLKINLDKITDWVMIELQKHKKDDEIKKIDTFMEQLNESVLVFIKEFDIKLEE